MVNDVEHTKETKKLPYPKSVFFIIGNEFCERFSYYGMRTILALYLKNVLGFGDDLATVIYHTFTMFCYFTPVFGAMIADSLLGKYRTIFYISIIYAFGNIILSLAATPPVQLPPVVFSMIGLALIAIGTGGIKPCVSAFGGDQFILPQQERQLQQFFSVFYFSINSGSLISTFLTPILREDVKCFGDDSCYSLAFGVPAVLMIISLILFIMGSSLYKIKPAEGNIVLKVGYCIGHALTNKMSNKGSKRDHWLDHADDKYEPKLISDVRAMLNVLFLYLPLPVFWALFDQQGSRWTFQATRMSGDLGGYILKPDQMQVVNPLLILALIPIFETAIYPLFAKINFLVKPLQRITVGGLLAAAAFFISAIVELQLEQTYPVLPQSGEAQLRIFNSLDCPMNIRTDDIHNFNGTIQALEFSKFNIPVTNNLTFQVLYEGCASGSGEINVWESQANSYLLTKDGIFGKYFSEDHIDKSENGNPLLRVIYNLDFGEEENGTSSKIKLVGDETVYVEVNPGVNASGYVELDIGSYDVWLPKSNVEYESFPVLNGTTLQLGGIYTLMVERANGITSVKQFVITEPNSVHMLWLIPQYFVITVGEVMFSITGLEFSFTQAPLSMKSVLQAAWLLTVAFGNLIVVIVAEAKFFDRQALEFFLFAGLMVVDMVIFALMAMRYKYVDKNSEASDDGPNGEIAMTATKEKAGLDNQGFDDNDGKI